MNNTTNTTLNKLKLEYGKLKSMREDYGNANFISDLNDADVTYLKLRLNEEKAYRELKKAELNEYKFNNLFAPVIDHRIQNLKNRLSNRGVTVL